MNEVKQQIEELKAKARLYREMANDASDMGKELAAQYYTDMAKDVTDEWVWLHKDWLDARQQEA